VIFDFFNCLGGTRIARRALMFCPTISAGSRTSCTKFWLIHETIKMNPVAAMNPMLAGRIFAATSTAGRLASEITQKT
jgi:hypothetical protein